jgi:predicted HicB family RNase H-like nuclease
VAFIHYKISDDLHRRAKAAAALQGKTLKDFVTEAVEEATKKAESKKRR